MLLRPKRLASWRRLRADTPVTPGTVTFVRSTFRKTEAHVDFATAVEEASRVLPFPRHDGPGFDLDEHVRQVDPDSSE